MKLAIFYASHLFWPFAIICILAIWRGGRAIRILSALALIGTSILAYARFVEPRILTVERATIALDGSSEASPTLRIALFSDTHYGVFPHAMPMARIVTKVNAQNPDAVMIAGDFLYELPAEDIAATLAPLADLNAPVFAVMGNHDVGFPGPNYGGSLYAALRNLGVTLVENRAHEVTLGGHEVIVAGSSDLWEGRQSFRFSADLPDKPLFLLTHNPDTALNVPDDFDYDLMLAGHTHGAQIRLPGMVQRVIPTQLPFDKGIHTVSQNGYDRLVYVSTGTGMVGLPMRFRMPPRIDVLDVRLPD